MSDLDDLLEAKLENRLSGQFDLRVPAPICSRTYLIDRVSAILIFYKMADGLSLHQCKTMIDKNFPGNIESRELGEFFHAFIVETLKGD